MFEVGDIVRWEPDMMRGLVDFGVVISISGHVIGGNRICVNWLNYDSLTGGWFDKSELRLYSRKLENA